jgi:hypothetical protein
LAFYFVAQLAQIALKPPEAVGMLGAEPRDYVREHPSASDGRQLTGIANENGTKQSSGQFEIQHRSFVKHQGTDFRAFATAALEGQIVFEPSIGSEE